jgi:hypothetical protein
MTLTWAEFCGLRRGFSTQYFPFPGATRTILVSSHIWWTDQIALSLRNLGFNVILSFPLYLLYTDPATAARFDELWNGWIQQIREFNVQLIIGGNASAMVRHPRTGEMLHEAAATPGRPIPLVNWWWDEPRTRPAFAASPASAPTALPELSPQQYLACLANPNTLNAIWDIDVLEELEAQFALSNLLHLPLATLPEFWPQGFIPLEKRPLSACFLGNCHFAADWVESDNSPWMRWAREIVRLKSASPDTPMQTCAREATARLGTPAPTADMAADPWIDFTRPWELVNSVQMHFHRNQLVRALAGHLGGKLALIGRGWEQLGLRPNLEHAGDKSGAVYQRSQACISLAGGSVHGGLPLRPYDIAASGGLIVSHYRRELPALFEPGTECLAFRDAGEMLEQIDRVHRAPRDFNAIAKAGRKRLLAHHTWAHRLRQLLAEVESRWPAR